MVDAIDFLRVGHAGSAFLWTVFAVMGVSALIILGMSFARKPHDREFHYVSTIITATAGLAYLCMALGVGNTHIGNRVFLIQRYIDWMITTPLLLLDLCLIAGRSLATIFSILALDELMIVSGLMGEVTTGPTTWALFAFSMCCYLPIMYLLVEDFHKDKCIHTFGEKMSSRYMGLVGYLIFVWLFYPLCWVLHRAKVIGITGEIYFYGVLDILAKPIFAGLILASAPSRRFLGEKTAPGIQEAGATHHHHHTGVGTGRTGGRPYDATSTVGSERDVEMSNPYTGVMPADTRYNPTTGTYGGHDKLEEVKLAT